eukprot:1673557-Amphidinium_carterae.1
MEVVKGSGRLGFRVLRGMLWCVRIEEAKLGTDSLLRRPYTSHEARATWMEFGFGMNKVIFVCVLIRTRTLRCWLSPTFPRDPGHEANGVELSPE